MILQRSAQRKALWKKLNAIALIELFGQTTSKLSSASVTLERVIWISSITSVTVWFAKRASRVSRVTRESIVRVEEFDSGRINICTRLTCYTCRICRTACVYGYFNEVVHCAKTKLDNFIAIALARSTSIIFHYVSFPFRPPLHLTD